MSGYSRQLPVYSAAVYVWLLKTITCVFRCSLCQVIPDNYLCNPLQSMSAYSRQLPVYSAAVYADKDAISD